MVLTRESIKNGIIDELIRQAGDSITPLTPEEREASRLATLAARPEGQPVWVFGYGSLIWNPAFHFAEQRLGRVEGFHRSFCMRILSGRGSEDFPGLMLALDQGGTCDGVVFRLDEDAVEEETRIIWEREMIAGTYQPTWVTVETKSGPVGAFTFVVDQNHNRYVGRLSEEEQVAVLARAAGPIGAGCEYLYQTTAHLEAMGIGDPELRRLSEQVAALQGLDGPPGLDEDGT